MSLCELNIDLLKYDSVIDYVLKNMSKWIDRQSGYTLNEYESYANKKAAYEREILIKKASELLIKKYACKDKEPSHIAKLLLSTEDKIIIYNNDSDPVFGSKGYSDTNNFIGKKLMSIRDEILKKKYKEYKVELPKIKMISEMFENKSVLNFAIIKVKNLYQLMTSFKDHPQIKDLKLFEFIYKNFFDCIEKRDEKDEKDNTKIVTKYITISKFNKINVPADFTDMTDINCSKECKQELWKYMFYVYNRTLTLYTENKTNGTLTGESMFVILNKMMERQIKKETKMLSLFSTDSFEDRKKYEKRQKVMVNFDKDILSKVKNYRKRHEILLQNHDLETEKINFSDFGGFSEEILLTINNYTPINFALFLTTDESQYSSLLPSHIPFVSTILDDWFTNPKIIVDATAHIGVDTIHFATVFKTANIYSYEINNITFQLLEENVKRQEFYNKKLKDRVERRNFAEKKMIKHLNVVDLEGRIHVNNSDFLIADLPMEIADFIYIDAPWGGPSYKKIPIGTLELYLGNVNIKEIARLLLVGGRTKEVVIKVPFNYRFDNLENWFTFDRKDVQHTSYSLVKLQIKPVEVEKCNIRSLCISTFVSILNAIKIYRKKDKIDENDLKLAFRLLYLSGDTVFPDKYKPYNIFYLDVIASLFNVNEEEILEEKLDDERLVKTHTKKDTLINKIIKDMKQSENIYDYEICEITCEKCGAFMKDIKEHTCKAGDEEEDGKKLCKTCNRDMQIKKHKCKPVCITEKFKEFNDDIIVYFSEINEAIIKLKRETFVEEIFSKKDALEKLKKIYAIDSNSSKTELELLHEEFPDVNQDLLRKYLLYVKNRYDIEYEKDYKKNIVSKLDIDIVKISNMSIIFEQLVEAVVKSLGNFSYNEIISRLMLFSSPQNVEQDIVHNVLYVEDENVVEDEIENDDEDDELRDKREARRNDGSGSENGSENGSRSDSRSIGSVVSGDEFGDDDEFNHQDD